MTKSRASRDLRSLQLLHPNHTTSGRNGSAGRKRQATHSDLTAGDGEDTPITMAAKQTTKSKRRKPNKSSNRECTICCEMYATEQFPSSPHDGAGNDHSVCYKCWENHLHAELGRKAWDALSCAHCGEVLGLADIYKLDGHFEIRVEPRMMELATKACLKEDNQWIDCPSAACRSGATMQDGHIFTCQDCQYRYCFSCNVQMHEGQSCTEFQEGLKRNSEKTREEELSLATVQAVSKPCPKCRTNLDKFTGCDHVTCRACKHDFCWICFADYKGPTGISTVGNSAHKPECDYAPDRLPSYQAGAYESDGETASIQEEEEEDGEEEEEEEEAELALQRDWTRDSPNPEQSDDLRRQFLEADEIALRQGYDRNDTLQEGRVSDAPQRQEDAFDRYLRDWIRYSPTPEQSNNLRRQFLEADEIAFRQGYDRNDTLQEGRVNNAPQRQEDALDRYMRTFMASP